ncbi:MAG: nucleoside diphosphate kinase regulator [Acidobacteriota bacterium]
MKEHIVVTKTDLAALYRLVEARRPTPSPDRENLNTLEQELDRAEVVGSDAVSSDVVTMNSEVRLKDLDSGEEKTYTLVYPGQVRTETSVSVLAPIGTAMLGYRVGDVIEWRVPKGIRRWEVLEVQYQPEAAGVGSSAV